MKATNLPNSHGALLLRTIADPVAGTQIDLTLNETVRILLRSLRFTLVTDATVANRNVYIEIQESGTTFLRCYANLTQTAGQTIIYNFIAGGPDRAAALNSEINVQLPLDYIIRGTLTGFVTAANLQAGDNFSGAQQLTEEWIEL